MIKNFNSSDIINSKELNKNFINANSKELKINCNIYNGNFYLDTFNYFVIDESFNSFKDLYSRDPNQNVDHFFKKTFFDKFNQNRKDFKTFNNVFILGLNSADNYYSNLIQFLPRLFFLYDKRVNLGIHRNSSLNFRNFIKLILDSRNIEFKFVYLDDNFYKFNNSKMPQFFDLLSSIKILKNYLIPKKIKEMDKKIYVTRENSSYRKIVNESDIIPILRSNGYKIINPFQYTIDEQIRIFSQADKIISPHGSNLSNIIFCKPGTEIYETGPKFEENYEVYFENRYKILSEINNLKYSKFTTDSINVQKHSDLTKKFINKKILENSNYYKNLILKISDINKMI